MAGFLSACFSKSIPRLGMSCSDSALERILVNQTIFPFAGNGSFKKTVPFEYFHLNSVIIIGRDFLVNNRYLWSTFQVTRNGDVAVPVPRLPSLCGYLFR